MSDFPDWTSPPQRPEYGKAKSYVEGKNCDAGGITLIKEITGKGVLLGGFFVTTDGDASQFDYPILKIDGQSFSHLTFLHLLDWTIYNPRAHPLLLSCYDTIHPRYAVRVGMELSFLSSVEFSYAVNGAGVVWVDIGITYQLVE